MRVGPDQMWPSPQLRIRVSHVRLLSHWFARTQSAARSPHAEGGGRDGEASTPGLRWCAREGTNRPSLERFQHRGPPPPPEKRCAPHASLSCLPRIQVHHSQMRQAILQLSERVGTHVPVFQQMQIMDHARYLGVDIGPRAANHRWTKARNKFVGVCARIRTSSQSFVQRLDSFKIYAFSILSFITSVAEPDAPTITAETLALQRLSVGPDGSTLEATTRSCDEKYLHPATAFQTSAAFRLVNAIDSLRSLGSLPLRKMQSGAAALICQNGSILDISLPLPFAAGRTQPLASSTNIVFSPSWKAFIGLPTLAKLA